MDAKDLKKLVKEQPGLVRTEVMDVFFEAMNEGYVSHPKKGTIAELPGSKTITYVRRPWKVIDTYIVTPLGSRSGGMTVISYENVPVWMMQYFGEYAEEAIPCLKAALRDAYENKLFYGGRGPKEFKFNGFMYVNFPSEQENTHVGFSGIEEIYTEEESKGWHRYQGGLMF